MPYTAYCIQVLYINPLEVTTAEINVRTLNAILTRAVWCSIWFSKEGIGPGGLVRAEYQLLRHPCSLYTRMTVEDNTWKLNGKSPRVKANACTIFKASFPLSATLESCCLTSLEIFAKFLITPMQFLNRVWRFKVKTLSPLSSSSKLSENDLQVVRCWEMLF